MPTRKLNESSIRNLTKLGGHSIGITIPINIIRKLGWRERQKVVVRRRGKRVVIEDWKK